MPAIEALWSVTFTLNARGQPYGFSEHRGIAVLEKGRILGGDVEFTYVGRYSLQQGGNRIQAEIEMARYQTAATGTALGSLLEHVALRLAGNIEYLGFVLTGHMVERPQVRVAAVFARRAELPKRLRHKNEP